MALDRFVYFRKTPGPTREELSKVLEDYLGEAATEVKWDGDRFFVTLRGAGSHPFKRVVDRYLHVNPERWIEVRPGQDNIDVLTREADEYTNVVAEGLARLLARFYVGEFEE